jgi:hypothetical protein
MNKKNITYGMVFLIVVGLFGYMWQRGQIDYSDTTWLTIKGYKAKGFEPYIKVAYGSEGEACKEFVWGLGDFLAQNIKRVYEANITKDDLHYSIPYPMNFTRGGCTFWAVKVYVKLQEYNDLDEKEYPKDHVKRGIKIFDNTIGGYSIKYHKPNATYSLEDTEANLLVVNNYCKKFVFKGSYNLQPQWIKTIACHPEGYSFKRSYFSFESFVLKHPVFTFNLAMDEKVYARTDPQHAKQLKLKLYNENFEPKKADFVRFKTQHKIEE